VAHHRLKRTPRSLSQERFEDNPAWEKLHRTFHRILVSPCGSRPLVTFCDQLADQLYRYRRLSIVKAYPSRPVAEEHQAILDAVLARDADQATTLLAAHFTATAEVLLEDRVVFPEVPIAIVRTEGD
jgi:DNA-binding GntR family transcriptional regulator